MKATTLPPLPFLEPNPFLVPSTSYGFDLDSRCLDAFTPALVLTRSPGHRFLPPPLPLAALIPSWDASASVGQSSSLGSPMSMSPPSTPERAHSPPATALRAQPRVLIKKTDGPHPSLQRLSRSEPTSPTQSPPASPMAESRRTPSKGVKRKRTRSARAVGQETLVFEDTMAVVVRKPQAGQPSHASQAQSASDVVFDQGSHVAKWKLNAPRYKKCKIEASDGRTEWKKCLHCGTDSTPEWRNGPLGKGTLCNACGLRYRSRQRENSPRSPGGNVPLSLLLNPESVAKKGQQSPTSGVFIAWEGPVPSTH